MQPTAQANSHWKVSYPQQTSAFFYSPFHAVLNGGLSSNRPRAGAVESMAKELAWLAPGIKPLIFESGIFNTEIMKNIHHADSRVPFWKPLNDAARIRGEGNYGKAPGDAVKMIKTVIQIIKGTGVAEGKEIPLRIPLGSDCLAAVREKANTLQKIYDDWEDVAKSTDFEGAGAPMPDIPTR